MNRRSLIAARIRQYCAWFDLDPIEIPPKGELPDELIDWCLAVGASIDWIVCGDPMPMAGVCRQEYLAQAA